jgi:hypothetical protein
MKPLDPDQVPTHIATQRGGSSGLMHGIAPLLPRSFTRAHPNQTKRGRRGAKARAKMKRILASKYGIAG